VPRDRATGPLEESAEEVEDEEEEEWVVEGLLGERAVVEPLPLRPSRLWDEDDNDEGAVRLRPSSAVVGGGGEFCWMKRSESMAEAVPYELWAGL